MYAHTYMYLHAYVHTYTHKNLPFPQLDTNAVMTNKETSIYPDPNV